MSIIRLQTRGMLTIPRDVRKALGLTAGQSFVVKVEASRRIVLEPLPPWNPDELFDRYPISEPVTPAVTRAKFAEALSEEQGGRRG